MGGGGTTAPALDYSGINAIYRPDLGIYAGSTGFGTQTVIPTYSAGMYSQAAATPQFASGTDWSSYMTAAGLVGSGVSAFTQMQQGDFSSAIAGANADAYRDSSREEIERADRERTQYEKQMQLFMGTQRATYGASGVRVDEGSPLLVLEDTAREMKEEADFITWGGEVAAQRYLNMASISDAKGKQAQRASRIGAGTTLLTDASRFAMMRALM